LVVHFEGISYNADGTSGLSYTDITRAKFIGKWSDALHTCYLPQKPEHIFAARDRGAGSSILVMDDRVPVCHQGAGFPRAYQMLKLLAELGYKMTFFPLGNTVPWQPYTGELQQLGIEVFYGDKLDFMRFSKDRTRQYDLVLVSRPYLMESALPIIEEFFPDAALVYDAEAFFSLREILKAKVKGTKLEHIDVEHMVLAEIRLLKKADLVITVSENEKAIILKKTSLDNMVVWGHPVDLNETKTPFSERNDLLFIGAFPGLDSPNEDAILYFANEIFPRIQQELHCRLFIVGNNPPEPVKQLASPSIIVTGYVEDLSEYYEKCRIFVVPHRYSAGIPLKLLDAMGHGMPSVVSELTALQLKLTDGKETMVAKNTSEFVDKLVRLFKDEELWYQLQQNALHYIQQECNRESLKTALKQIIVTAMTKSRRKQNHK
jgi:glycosyltransferase involved in cell wall biosynthesis